MASSTQLFLSTIVESSDDAIISKTLEGIITSWNNAAEKIFGYTEAEMIGQSITKLIPEDRGDEEPSILERLRRGEKIDHFETVRRRKDGQLINVLLTVTPIKNEEGVIIGASKIARDITSRTQADEIQARLASIVESSDDAIISKTLQGIIISWNRGAEKIFGYTADEVIGQHVSILIPEDRYDEEPEILARLRNGEKIDHYETIRKTKDGRLRDISITVSPLKDHTGKIIGASKIARDITDRKRYQENLKKALENEQEARRQAEEANRVKDEFIATISHELRTPLTSLLGWTRLLLSGQLDPNTTRNALETIERNVKSQAQLIEDLLDVSRITTGKLRLNQQKLDLEEVIRAAVETARPAISAKNIKLRIILNDAAPIYGDFERLQQIIWNLLSNAIKFTPAGGHIEIELDRKDNQIELAVTDNGEGIKPEFIPRLFERFTQADSSITRPHGGLGLGLAIVKHLTELHGGTVSAISAGLGHGATFKVLLPVMPKPIEADRSNPVLNFAPVEQGANKSELNGKKLLVVDDEPDTLSMLKTLFEQCGTQVMTANSVDTAIEILDQWTPNILVSDIGMPGRNGFDLINYVRAKEAANGGQIPAVALTAYARIEDRVKVLAAGYQMHIPKPIEPDELIAVVSSLTNIIKK